MMIQMTFMPISLIIFAYVFIGFTAAYVYKNYIDIEFDEHEDDEYTKDEYAMLLIFLWPVTVLMCVVLSAVLFFMQWRNDDDDGDDGYGLS